MAEEQAKKAGGVLAALGVAWFWFSQATSIIGLVGIIEDLQTWATFAGWLMQQLNAMAPAVATALEAMGAFVHAGLELFHSIFRPILNFLLGWLPFDVPQVVKDALVVAVFMALGTRRVQGRTRAGFGRLIDRDHAKLRADATAFGLQLTDHSYGPGSVGELQGAVEAHWRLRGVPWQVTNDELRRHYENDVEAARRSFGERFDEFAGQQQPPNGLGLDPDSAQLLERQRGGFIFVFALAALTIVIVAVDFFLFK